MPDYSLNNVIHTLSIEKPVRPKHEEALFTYQFVASQKNQNQNPEHVAVPLKTHLVHNQLQYSLHIERCVTQKGLSYPKHPSSLVINVILAIIIIQSDYFLTGDMKQLKAMRLKDVADRTGLHLSTVAKIIQNKSVTTSFGELLLKQLFSEGIRNTSGELISRRVIQNEIKELIDAESKCHSLSDQKISDLLKNKGVMVARRTITKYRELLQIPGSQYRYIQFHS